LHQMPRSQKRMAGCPIALLSQQGRPDISRPVKVAALSKSVLRLFARFG
jgi:hypothetical protein